MKSKILMIIVIFAGLLIGAGAGIFGYRWYSAKSTPETISMATQANNQLGYNEIPLANTEDERILTTNGHVERADKVTLALKLTDGSWIRLSDEVLCGRTPQEPLNPAHCLLYNFIQYLEKAHSYVVETKNYEGKAIILINDRTGAKTEILGFPHLSPSGVRFVSFAEDEKDDQNSIETWNLSSGEPVKEWEYWPSNHARYIFRYWNGENEVLLFVNKNIDNSNNGNLPIKLLRLPEWHIEGLPEKSP